MKQVSLETVTQGYVHVTFPNDPRNLLDADSITELSEVVDRLGHQDVKVRVLASRNPDSFMPRYDLTGSGAPAGDPLGSLQHVTDVSLRLPASPVLTIAQSLPGQGRREGDRPGLRPPVRQP